MTGTRAIVVSLLCVAGACRGEARPGPSPSPVVPSPTAAPSPIAAPPPSPAPLALPPVTTATRAASAGARPRAKNVRTPLGTNLQLMKSYSGEWVWKDAFRQASFWRSENRPGSADDRPLETDLSGWVRTLAPGQRAVARFFGLPGMIYPSGVYTASWEGSGRVEFSGGVRVIGTQAQGAVLQVDGRAGGFSLSILALDPRNPIKNIKVMMPGGSCSDDDHRWCESDAGCTSGARCVPFAQTYESQPFHPTFLASNEPYSTLRFMHWGETIGSPVQSWNQRPRVDGAMWTPVGVPYEKMIELSNHMQTDMWLTIPHLADDDFVTQLATLVKTKLDPNLKVYVEYSNEIWNFSYPMGAVMRERGLKLGLSPDPFEAMIRYYSRRSVEIFKIFSRVLVNENRLVRVLAGQSDHERVAFLALDFEKAWQHVDAFAIAPYFGGVLGTEKAYGQVVQATPDQLIAVIQKDWLPHAIDGMKKHKALLEKFDKQRKVPIELVAYEGGQHLVGVGRIQDDERIHRLFLATNRHPKMKDIYLDYLKAWKQSGGHLFMHFVHTRYPTKWGAFGAIDRPGQTRAESPKLDALMTFIEQNPRWW